MRLKGFPAIEYAEKHNLRLSKRADSIDEAREGLTIAEAEAIATEDESLIYLDVPDALYQSEQPISYDPAR